MEIEIVKFLYSRNPARDMTTHLLEGSLEKLSELGGEHTKESPGADNSSVFIRGSHEYYAKIVIISHAI